MSYFKRVCTVITVGVLCLLPAAFAELNNQQTQNFINTFPEVTALGDAMTREGKEASLKPSLSPQPGVPFKPYANATYVVKQKFPLDYAKLAAIVLRHGFPSPEAWANTADQVMLAYVSLQSTQQQNAHAQAMMQAQMSNPEIMKMMPPEAIANMQAGLELMNTMRAVPAQDRAIVSRYAPQIERWTQR